MESDWFDQVPGTRFDRVTWFPEIGSTNTELMNAARRGEPEGAVLIADLQTAGRGRRGRRWSAPPGTSLMMSVLLRPSPVIGTERASLVTSAFAIAARDAVKQQVDVELALKWPNDLVVDAPANESRPGDLGYRKIAGILTESLLGSDSIDALVVGMGMNTGWPEVPGSLRDIAASLNLLSGALVDRPSLAMGILERFEEMYAALLGPDGPEAVLGAVRRYSATIGRDVRIELGDGRAIDGHAADLDQRGQLIVDDEAGVRHVVAVGDVLHLRPRGI